MKYFFITAFGGATHVVIAKSADSARALATKAKLDVSDLYELTPGTFNTEGFLVSSK